jgi:hypothetical protein
MKIYYNEGFITVEANNTSYKSKVEDILKYFKMDNNIQNVDYLLKILKRFYLLNPEEFISKLESAEIDLISDLLQHPQYSQELDAIYKDSYKTQIQNIFDKHGQNKDAILADITKLFE